MVGRVKYLGCLSILAFLLAIQPPASRAANTPLVVTPPSTNSTGAQVTTGWTASPDTNVTGYYFCWGLASGGCTNLIDVGNVTTATLGGLSTNVTYYFTVVAYDGFGDQAVPSNEIQYMVTNTVVAVQPSIVADLTNTTVVAGNGVAFQVGVSGSSPLAFQWLFNGAPLAGATADTLTLNNVTVAQSGTYQVIVTNAAGSATSSVANLIVLTPPSITTDLSSQTVKAGTNLTLQVAAAGSAPLVYKWLFNGSTLAGATSSSLVLNNVSSANAGTYQLIITNSAGSASSSVATLTVLTPPNITTDLSSQTVKAGTNLTLQVAAAGSAPLVYKWLFNGSTLAGATSSSLALNNVSSANSGTYQVIITNDVGKATSSPASLTVLSPPTILTDLTNQVAVAGSNVAFAVEVAGAAPFGFVWTFNGTNLAAGNSNSLYLAEVTPSQEGVYQVQITNALGAVTSAVAQLSVLVPPSIASNLADQVVASGDSVTFQVNVSGTAPISYQWLRNGSALAGKTSDTLILSDVGWADAGAYQVLATNAAGSAVSLPAVLTVLSPPVISQDLASQTLAAGSTATLQISAEGSGPLAYQWLFKGMPLVGASANPLVISDLAQSNAGSYQVIVTNPVGTATSMVANLTVLLPPSLITDLTNQNVTLGSNATLAVDVSGSGPFTYQWLFNGTNLVNATANPLVLTNFDAAAEGLYAVVVANQVGTITSSVASMTLVSPPSIIQDLTTRVVAVASDVTLQVAVSGTGPMSYQWQCEGTNLLGATANPLVLKNVTRAQSGTYQVLVTNIVGAVVSSPASLTILAPPTITSDLVDQNVAPGSPLTLGATVVGDGPLSYQWLFNGQPLNGATQIPLIIESISSTNAGTYQLVITNLVGSAASAVASVSIQGAPTMARDLTNQTVVAGLDVTLAVSAASGSPLSYQWRFNGTALPNATTDALTLSGVSTAQAGVYQVVVSNSSGSITSSKAMLDVLETKTLRIKSQGNGLMQLDFGGFPGKTYTLQSCTNLDGAWQSLGTFTADPSGVISLSTSGGASPTLYRVALP